MLTKIVSGEGEHGVERRPFGHGQVDIGYDRVGRTSGRREARVCSGIVADRTLTVRQRLRQATAVTHEGLHRHPGFVSLLEGRITLPAYRALLARLHGFYRPLECGLRAAPRRALAGLHWPECERSPGLRADLRFLGLDEGEVVALAMVEGLPPVRSRPEVMGRLYVVEGSALGGRLMASKLDGILGPGTMEGRRFFSGRAAPDPLPWQAFCGLLETGDESSVDTVIESARTTFHALSDWLTEGDVHV